MLSNVNNRSEYIRRINLALQFMEKFYGENIGLKEIADAAFFSKYHFHRIFSSLLDEAPTEYLRRIRLEKAASFLQLYPNYSITRIAIDTGFSSSSVFSRSFQNYFNTTPKKFRKEKIRKKSQSTLVIADKKVHSDDTTDEKYAIKKIRQLPSLRLAFVRSMSGYNSRIAKAWNTLFSWALPNEIINSDTRLFGIPLDDPEITTSGKCRYFASLTIGENITPSGPIELMVLEKGWYASFSFSGNKSEMSSFYQWVYRSWLPESGYIPEDRPFLEEYPHTNVQSSKRSTQERIFSFTLLLPIRSL